MRRHHERIGQALGGGEGEEVARLELAHHDRAAATAQHGEEQRDEAGDVRGRHGQDRAFVLAEAEAGDEIRR